MILERMNAGDEDAAQELLPLVYDELRRIARVRISNERPGQTLQATALVHEAWLRLQSSYSDTSQPSRKRFFAAAAEAMRRVLVDIARRKSSARNGGGYLRVSVNDTLVATPCPVEEVLAVHGALDRLAEQDPVAGELVKLHYFGGFSLEQAGEMLGIPRASAYRLWTFARTFLRAVLQHDSGIL